MNPTAPEQTDSPISYYVSIISGACLVISEILPYLSSVKGNGILHILSQAFGKYEQKKQEDDQRIQEILQRLERLEKQQLGEK